MSNHMIETKNDAELAPLAIAAIKQQWADQIENLNALITQGELRIVDFKAARDELVARLAK